MNKKISLVIIERDEVDKTLDLIKNLYNNIDEIIIIDSSINKEFKKLEKFKASHKDKRFLLKYVVPLGYADPLHEYAVNLCNNDYILMLDADEVLSNDFIINIKKIIALNYDVYRVKFFDNNDFAGSYREVIFKKQAVEFTGIIHSSLKIKPFAQIKVLEDSYFLNNLTDNRQNKKSRYFMIEAFERRYTFNYLINYLKANEHRALARLVNLYIKLFRKDYNSELSRNGYRLLALRYVIKFLRHILFLIRISSKDDINYRLFINSIKYEFGKADFIYDMDQELYLKSFNISRLISKFGGVQKYLCLYGENLAFINKKYKDSRVKGVDLFIKLLLDRYKNLGD